MAASNTIPSKIVLVTGANQGLGLAVIESAGLRSPNDTYILCSRDIEKGNSAITHVREAGVKANLDLVQLDVTNDDQIAAAVRYVETKYGRLDVLVNNAGFVRLNEHNTELSAIRATFNEYMNVHVTSVAVITHAFTPLLHRSISPRVINVSSGLGSITNVLSPRRMGRIPSYGASKVGMNGLTAHLQVAENDRVADTGPENDSRPRIRFFISNPGVLKTSFSNYVAWGKDPLTGAESIVQLLGDDEGKFDHGMQWEFEDGEMRIVSW
ncbi:short chain dehydrogenase/reductase family protein [Arthroderma uncinatum]|uniref:short chain dehydrogenase/reductase family protein n=1 Tax=Arthroderma uncinatum TaxID=74035 RepID=UPI00144AB7FB|nr:short chain dehydrogenase/reductase family protein [Arthroderma uncinatum]KAF3481810.1 short chain dehydrogenase/reductase family protein [Arthroderma uncinatum]